MNKIDPPKYGNLKSKALVVVELCHICSDTLVDARPHQTIEQDMHVARLAARAAQLEGEETRNPSFFNTFPSPATPADLETTAPSPEQPQASPAAQKHAHPQVLVHRARFSVRTSRATWHQRPSPRAQPASPWGLRGRPRRSRGSDNGRRRCAGTTRRPRRHTVDFHREDSRRWCA